MKFQDLSPKEVFKMSFFIIPRTKGQTQNKPASKEIDYNSMPEADVLLDYVELRHSKGLGTNIPVIGLSGTGKSSVTLRLCQLYIERKKAKGQNVKLWRTNSTLQVVTAVRDSSPEDTIAIEELGVLFPSRRAMSSDNVNAGAIFDTIRKKRLVVIMNCPIWNTFDSHLRALSHVLVETLAINKQEQVVISKFHRLQTNPRSGQTYFHTFQRKGRDVLLMYTRMPDKVLWETYEKEKDAFMDNLYTRLSLKHEKKIQKENKELGIIPTNKEERRPLTAIQRETMEVLAHHTFKEASKILKKDMSTLHEYKTYAEKKGYYLDEFRDNALGEQKDDK